MHNAIYTDISPICFGRSMPSSGSVFTELKTATFHEIIFVTKLLTCCIVSPISVVFFFSKN
jgi:hypothetical protein